MYRLFALVGLLTITTSCGPPPHLVVRVEDAAGAAAAEKLFIGTDLDDLQPVHLQSTLSFPIEITVQGRKPGTTAIVVEARDAQGVALGRGQTTGKLSTRRGASQTVVSLRKTCESNLECADDLFFDGTSDCVDGICSYRDQPCGSSFECVTSTCIESDRRCEVSVIHSLCDDGEFCDPVHGCIPGEPCLTTADCDDNRPCNGQEECIGFRCRGGVAVDPADPDPCTLDGCDDNRVAQGLEPVFNIPDLSTDGNRCVLADSTEEGICRFSLGGCVVSACGDGFTDTAVFGEVCDDGLSNSNTWSAQPHCNDSCDGLAPHCGDGLIDDGDEVCDDGDRGFDGWRNDSHCNRACDSVAPHCGDGIVDAGFEHCDDGESNSDGWAQAGHCNADCTALSARCGDGLVEPGFEICDDGVHNSDAWSAQPHCNGTCSGLAAHCGDGAVTVGSESCDDGEDNSAGWRITAHCNTSCDGQGSYCGDGIIAAAFEACDDGTSNSNSWSATPHCNGACSGMADHCGDARVSPGNEVCDDGVANNDAWAVDPHCNNSCSALAPHCGDGIITAGSESCDDRADNSDSWQPTAHCNAQCDGKGPSCGDGQVSLGNEACDDGAANTDGWASSDHCDATCTGLGPYCGDGQMASGFEVCDDGAANSVGWNLQPICNTACSGSSPHCGDGVLDAANEGCDDGAANDDSWALAAHCDESCIGLAAYCGDGTIESGIETCDDGANNSDGWQPTAHCNGNCSGDGPYCDDGLVSLGNEACDDGAFNDDAWLAEPHCNNACSAETPHCGDGVLQVAHEACDDGVHADSGNGCSDTCQENHVCGDGIIQPWFEDCDDGQNGDSCDGCRDDCVRGCICATAQGCDAAGEECVDGQCIGCDTVAKCGPTCQACTSEWPICGGQAIGCMCETSPGPRGTCSPGTYCDGTNCIPCADASRCGGDCVPCGGETPVCGGLEVGCVIDPPGDCSGRLDFTRCQAVTDPDRSYDICIDGVCQSPGCDTVICNAPGPSFALPDTNQRSCHDATGPTNCPGTAGSATCATKAGCGQDAQYGWDTMYSADQRYTRSLSVPDQPIVIDQVTDLIWQGCDGGLVGVDCSVGGPFTLSWYETLVYCDELDWGGYLDWRLPDIYELNSLVHHGTTSATIDTQAFVGATAARHWSSSTFAPVPTTAWHVNFWTADWSTFNGWFSSKGDLLQARCVRGGTRPPQSPRYLVSEPVVGEPVVSDQVTDVMWQRCPAGTSGSACETGTASVVTRDAALAYCEDLDWAAHTDWRLPNSIAMQSITDFRLLDPALDPVFVAPPRLSFWTSTAKLSETVSLWQHFTGNGGLYQDIEPALVRCTRIP